MLGDKQNKIVESGVEPTWCTWLLYQLALYPSFIWKFGFGVKQCFKEKGISTLVFVGAVVLTCRYGQICTRLPTDVSCKLDFIKKGLHWIEPAIKQGIAYSIVKWNAKSITIILLE